ATTKLRVELGRIAERGYRLRGEEGLRLEIAVLKRIELVAGDGTVPAVVSGYGGAVGLYTSIPKGISQRPQKISAASTSWPCIRRNSIAKASRCGLSNTD